mgnify:CR=1 FL=1
MALLALCTYVYGATATLVCVGVKVGCLMSVLWPIGSISLRREHMPACALPARAPRLGRRGGAARGFTDSVQAACNAAVGCACSRELPSWHLAARADARVASRVHARRAWQSGPRPHRGSYSHTTIHRSITIDESRGPVADGVAGSRRCGADNIVISWWPPARSVHAYSAYSGIGSSCAPRTPRAPLHCQTRPAL